MWQVFDVCYSPVIPSRKISKLFDIIRMHFRREYQANIHHAKMHSIPTKRDYFYSQANMHGNKLFASVGTRL